LLATKNTDTTAFSTVYLEAQLFLQNSARRSRVTGHPYMGIKTNLVTNTKLDDTMGLDAEQITGGIWW